MEDILNIGAFLWLFVKPSSLLILLAILGLGLRKTRYRRAGNRLVVWPVILLLIFGTLPVGYWLLMPLQEWFPQAEIEGPAPYIVLLTGGEREPETAYYGDVNINEFGDRMIAAARLAREDPGAFLVVSGGNGSRFTQADVAERYFISVGIEEDRIVVDREAARTSDTAKFVAGLPKREGFEDNRPIVVTSAFHMPRTIAAFRGADIDVVPYPTDYRGSPDYGVFGGPFMINIPSNLALLDLASHEWVGLFGYWVTGRSGELFPAP